MFYIIVFPSVTIQSLTTEKTFYQRRWLAAAWHDLAGGVAYRHKARGRSCLGPCDDFGVGVRR